MSVSGTRRPLLARSQPREVLSARLSCHSLLEPTGLAVQEAALEAGSAGVLDNVKTLIKLPPQLGHIRGQELTVTDVAPASSGLFCELVSQNMNLVFEAGNSLLVHSLPTVEAVLQLLDGCCMSSMVSLPLLIYKTPFLNKFFIKNVLSSI